jgi:C_GCAxxG_C_C family probable redox protein
MKRSEKAGSYFNQGYNCAQSVLLPFSKEYGMDIDLAGSIASGFGGGFGRLQKTCGAVTGAIMVIGCRFFNKDNLKDSKEVAYQKTRDFIKKFKGRNGSISCLELIGVDLSTGEGSREAKEKNHFEKKCSRYVRDACEILEEIL